MESVQTSESTGKLAALRKCAHPDCTCTVTDEEDYCSDYCLESMRADAQRTKDEEGCACGHAECVSTVAIAPVAPFTS